MIMNVHGLMEKLIRERVAKILDKHYPTQGASSEDLEFNLAMKRGSNLMHGILTLEAAAMRKNEVATALGLFRDAQTIRPNAWAAINAEAKCLYFLEEYVDSQARNSVAKTHIRTGLSGSVNDQAKAESRLTSYHNLEAMIGIATKQYGLAIQHSIEGLSYTPDNVHIRFGYLRSLTLSNDMTGSLAQIEQMEEIKDFGVWALEFATRVDESADFRNLRDHSSWPEIKRRWHELAQKSLRESREILQKTSATKERFGKVLKVALILGVGFAARALTAEFGGLLEVEAAQGAALEDFTQETDAPRMVTDIEPFEWESQGLDGIVADIEPFTVSPSNIDPWLRDLLVG